jgi:DNA transformation protein and related proteins
VRGSEPFAVTRHDSMREWLEDRLQPLPELELRAMFGGFGIYADGTMFGILHTGRMYLKTDDATRPAFSALGSEPFRPKRGSALASYLEVPPEVLEDEQELLAWSRRALAVARATPPKSRSRALVSPEQILEGHPSNITNLAEKLRDIVRRAAPDATEAGYPGWRLIGYRSPHYFCASPRTRAPRLRARPPPERPARPAREHGQTGKIRASRPGSTCSRHGSARADRSSARYSTVTQARSHTRAKWLLRPG